MQLIRMLVPLVAFANALVRPRSAVFVTPYADMPYKQRLKLTKGRFVLSASIWKLRRPFSNKLLGRRSAGVLPRYTEGWNNTQMQ